VCGFTCECGTNAFQTASSFQGLTEYPIYLDDVLVPGRSLNPREKDKHMYGLF
jgi:hypothetical protein